MENNLTSLLEFMRKRASLSCTEKESEINLGSNVLAIWKGNVRTISKGQYLYCCAIFGNGVMVEETGRQPLNLVA